MPLHRISKELVEEILSQYPHLTSLNLSHNEITRIENLDALVDLERIDLSHNLVSRIENLSGSHGLRFLNLASNRIAHVPMSVNIEIPFVHTLDLSHNQLVAVDDLHPLSRCVELRHLLINGNPLVLPFGADADSLTAAIVALLPMIEEIDGRKITAEDRTRWRLQHADSVTQPGSFSKLQISKQNLSRPIADGKATSQIENAGDELFVGENLDSVRTVRLLEAQCERLRQEVFFTAEERKRVLHENNSLQNLVQALERDARSIQTDVLSLQSQVRDLSAEKDALRQQLLTEQEQNRNLSSLLLQSSNQRSGAAQNKNDRHLLAHEENSIEVLKIKLATAEDIVKLQEKQLASLSANVDEENIAQLKCWREACYNALLDVATLRLRQESEERRHGAVVTALRAQIDSEKDSSAVLRKKMEGSSATAAAEHTRVQVLEEMVRSAEEQLSRERHQQSQRVKVVVAEYLQRINQQVSSQCTAVAQIMYRQVKSRLDALDNRLSFSVMRMRWSATKGASRKLLVESSKREEAQAIQLMRKELDSVRQERDAALRRLASEDELLSSVVSDRLQRLKSMFSAEIDEKDRRIVQITGDLRDREAGLEAARKEIAQLTELVMRLRSEASRREHDVQQAQGELLRVRSASEDRAHAEAAQFKEKITQLEEQLRNVTKELGKKNALLRNSDREKEKLADAVRELRKERSTLMSSLRQVQAVEKGARLSPTSSMPKQAEKLSSIARLASRLLSSDEDSSAEEDESDEHVGYG